jgi:LacI family transcriptional regulator
MTQLGFSVNQHARSLVSNHSQLVGLVVQGISSGYSAQYDGPISLAAQSELAESQYNLILYNASLQNKREMAYVASLTRGFADGFLLLLPENPHLYIEALQQQQAPYVMIDHQGLDDPGPAVRSENRRGVYQAIQYLLELGHRRIGFITGHITWGCSLERLAGYKTALEEWGITPDPGLIREGNFTQPSGYNGAQALLALPEPPTAIFASNDLSAFGVMEAVRDHHLRIPEDISLVGFDDLTPTAHVHPPLTSVRQPLELIGRTAARMILKYIHDPDLAPEIIELPTELIIRQTCQRRDP